MADQSLILPPAFVRHTLEAFGAAGEAWLRDLRPLVAELARRWELTLGSPFELSYNYVAAARRADGTEAVLKIGVPNDERAREIAALRHYAGDGTCNLLAADEARAAVLLERLRPGEMLVHLARADDEAATRVGAGVMRTLWRRIPAGASCRPLAEWFEAFDRHRAAYGGPGPLPAGVFAHAERLARLLLASAPAPVLLHGDLHHYNILSATRAPWLAIDPKGMAGDPGYEVGPFLCNPRHHGGPRSREALRRRLDILAEELRYDRDRLRDWGIAHAVLSACWSAEDHGQGWEPAVATAEALMRL